MSDQVRRANSEFQWLLTEFANNTAGVKHATAVSADGLLLGSSLGRNHPDVEQFAALVAGLSSLARGAADFLGHRELEQQVIETSDGFVFIACIRDGSALAVMATKNCDMGLVGYEMTLLVDRVGNELNPALIAQLTNLLVVST